MVTVPMVRARARFPSGENLSTRGFLQPGVEGGLFTQGQVHSKFLCFLPKCRRLFLYCRRTRVRADGKVLWGSLAV